MELRFIERKLIDSTNGDVHKVWKILQMKSTVWIEGEKFEGEWQDVPLVTEE